MKIDKTKLTKVEIPLSPQEKADSLQKKPKVKKTKGEKRQLKKDRSKLQIKRDNPNSKLWKNKADKAWGAYQHHFKRECLVCGNSHSKLDAHHLIGRARTMTRHDPLNGVILCSYHHTHSVECSPHAGPIGFSEFLRENYPEKIDYVLKNQHLTGKSDYRESYELLKELIESAGGKLD